MKYTIFRTQIIIRLLLILGLGFSIIYVLTETNFWLVSIWLSLFVVFLFVELLRYIERTHREMENMLIAIQQGDFSNTFYRLPAMRGNMLSDVFNQLSTTFQQLRQDKEGNHLYLHHIVRQIKVAIICVDASGKVQLINEAAKSLLGKPFIKHLDDLKALNQELYQTLVNIQAGEKNMLKLILDQSLLQLLVQATEFRMQGNDFRIISMQDFRTELEEQEVASWQKLIRVLTHEIMNSVIPISNLSAMVNQMLISVDEKQTLSLRVLDQEDIQDLYGSLNTIEDRTKGLLTFVKAYKSLTQISQPQFKEIEVQALFQRVHALLKNKLEAQGIMWEENITPRNFIVIADFELIEQILINLIHNAVDALERVSSPKICVSAIISDKNQRVIQVKDNGKGIDNEVIEQVFIPFFTTKEQGSGIGLSLSRQIMRLHKGSISVQSTRGEGSIFSLIF